MIRCLIVDDEQHAIDILVHYISQTAYLELVSSTTRPIEALVVPSHEDREGGALAAQHARDDVGIGRGLGSRGHRVRTG